MINKIAGYMITALCLFNTASSAQSAPNLVKRKIHMKDTMYQKDLIDVGKRFLKISLKPVSDQQERKIYFSFLPSGGTAPGGSGRALVTSTTAAMYLGSPATTNISSATFTPYFNFKGRYGLPLRTSVWLPGNTGTIQGDIRFMIYPQYTWGLGNNYSKERVLIDYRYIRFYQAYLKRLKPYLFAGVGYEFDYHTGIKSGDTAIDLKEFTGYDYGIDGKSVSSGLSLNLFYDSRNNSINPLPGAFVNLKYRFNPVFMGSSYNGHSVFLDIRKYVSLKSVPRYQQNTLAFWSYFWTVLNKTVPYLDLPSTGWDPYNRSARGIDQNRYRGRSLFYFETEYRRDITRNGLLGFVLFTNINTVSGSGTLFTRWHPAAGGGLRIKFNKKSATNIAIDYGFSQGYSAFKLALGEAF